MSALFHLFPALLPDALHRAVWDVTQQPRWGFGSQSTQERGRPFWHMDLVGAPAVEAAWQHARPGCEAVAGKPLRVIRVYANGHTYGQGGQPHYDDTRDDTYTLLYYPMPEWRTEWEGETVFFDGRGDVTRSVLPLPNRALLFDARIPHAGRAPGRAFGGLRITVAFKLEVPR